MSFSSPTGAIYYSHEGDDGRTNFGAHGMLPKYDERVIAAADCDEANASVSLVMAATNLSPDVVALLQSVQNDLFDVVADLHAPMDNEESATVRITDGHIARIERAIDFYVQDAEDLTGILLPGGTLQAGLLYTARTVVRRAECSTWAAVDAHPGQVNPLTARYLNRLSPLLFVLFRAANAEHGDLTWEPGASVRPAEDTAEARAETDAGE